MAVHDISRVFTKRLNKSREDLQEKFPPCIILLSVRIPKQD